MCILLNISYGDEILNKAVIFMAGMMIANIIFDDIDRYAS